MINGVKRITELMDNLPEITVGTKDHGIRFDFGTQKDLNKWLKLNRNRSKYPLVWLLTPTNQAGSKGNIAGTYSIILATLNKDVNMGNRERLRRSFDLVIDPLTDIVLNAFYRASSIDYIEREVGAADYYNYSEDDVSHESTEIWDARRLDVNIGINGNCLRLPLFKKKTYDGFSYVLNFDLN